MDLSMMHFLLALVLSFYPMKTIAVALPCDKTYKGSNGHLCFPCSPGFYAVSDCVDDYEQARCKRCDAGEFQPHCDNSTRCVHCNKFCLDSRQEKVKNCSSTSDIDCQCKDGFYLKTETGEQGYCTAHSTCKPGEGLMENGTPYRDTNCTVCQEGDTYSDKDSLDTCTPCSTCNAPIARNCTPVRDVVCSTSTESPVEVLTSTERPLEVSSSTECPPRGLGNGIIGLIVVSCVVLAIVIVNLVVLVRICQRYNITRIEDGANSFLLLFKTGETNVNRDPRNPRENDDARQNELNGIRHNNQNQYNMSDDLYTNTRL